MDSVKGLLGRYNNWRRKGQGMNENKEDITEEMEATQDETEQDVIIEDAVVEDEVSGIEKKLQERENQVKEYVDKYQRTLAEFDNFRKRTTKEKASMYDDGVRDTIEQLLPIMDNFERALKASTNKEDTFYKGVDMIVRQVEGMLDYLDVTVIPTMGEKFDPSRHNAVAHVQDENFSENEIIDELQKGYIYKDKVIRFSMVRVAN